jgi:hypothetical protein
VHVGPQRAAVDGLYHLHQVVVVVPVDPDHHEAQQVGEQLALLVQDVGEMIPVRRPQLEHEDRDEDGHHAIAEGEHALGSHRASMSRGGASPSR